MYRRIEKEEAILFQMRPIPTCIRSDRDLQLLKKETKIPYDIAGGVEAAR